jgi:VanZ family protein
LKEPRISNRIARPLLFGYLAFLVYASLYPISSFRPPEESPLTLLFERFTISRTDALTNLLVYLPLGWLLAVGIPGLRPLRAALYGCAFSFAIECLQAYLPGRVPSLLDWCLNSAGTLLGASLGSRAAGIQWRGTEGTLVAGPRARLGLAAVGTWVGAQLFPFVPSADVDHIKDGLRPLWYVLRGQTSFSWPQASVYALAILSLSVILFQCLRPSSRGRLSVPLFFAAVLVAKVPILTRQLSLEAIVGALAGLAVAWRLSDSGTRGAVPFLAAAGAFVVDELRSGGGGPGALHPFNWSPFRNHLTNELIGAADILSGAWPFLALAFVVSGRRSIDPRRAAAIGGVLVFAAVMALEWVQQLLPGRSPDVTDALIALCAWLLAFFAFSGSGPSPARRPAPADRLQREEPRSRPPASR